METEFDEIMRQHSDAELIEILNSEPGDYKDSAMESARREFKSRNLSAERIEQVKGEIEQQKEYEREIEQSEPPGLPTSLRYRFWRWFFSDGEDEN
ncbi:MAG TPA: hypothetical protein VHS53_17180 [Mucilaginibacter sp.]|jgi:hypothetical protein|nr:hypothetical protein [Mucilaginibacter sp.]